MLIPDFFREKTFNYKDAGLTVSIFYISMIFGRIIISLLENRIKMDFIIIITSVIASVSLVFMIFLNYKILIFIHLNLVVKKLQEVLNIPFLGIYYKNH